MGYNCQRVFMKSIANLLFAVLVAFTVVSCNKKDKDVDPRDEFVGAYSFTQTGSASLLSNGSTIGTIPMNGAGNLVCSKVGTGNQVKLTGDIVADVDGTVSGNTLVLNPTTLTGSTSGFSMQYTINYQPATKNGNTVTCLADINGAAQGNGTSAIISGKITLVASKK